MDTTAPDMVLDYQSQPAHSLEELQARVRGTWLAVPGLCVATVLFCHNTRRAIRRLYAQPNNLVSWLITGQSVAGVVGCGVMGYAYMLSLKVNCRQLGMVGMSLLALAGLLCNLLLLLKAYIAHQRHRYLLYAGLVLVVPGPLVSLIVIVTRAPIYINTNGYCMAAYPHYFPWLRLALEAPANLVFSAAFVRVAIRQYQQHGSDCWYVLARDGISIMCGIAAMNLFCAVAMAVELAGQLSVNFLMGDWVVTTTLLVHHVTAIERGTLCQPPLHSGRPRISERPPTRSLSGQVSTGIIDPHTPHPYQILLDNHPPSSSYGGDVIMAYHIE